LALALGACGARGPVAEPLKVFPLSTDWLVPLERAPLPPIVTDGERLLVATRGTAVQAFVPETGSLLWRRHQPIGQLAAAPGLLVVREADGTLSRLAPESGELIWKVQTGIAGDLPPVIDDDRILVVGTGIAALSAESGRPIWGDSGTVKVTTPPVTAGRYTLVTEQGGVLRCRDRETGATVWEHATGGTLAAPPVVDESGRILLGTTSRRFLALDLHEPRRVRWRWKVGTDITVGAALLEGRVIFASLENVLYALKRSNGNLVWRQPLPSRPLSAPQPVGPIVIQACQENEILGFNAKTGRKAGGIRTPSEMRTAPLVLGERVFVGLRNPWALAGLAFASLAPAKPPPDEEAGSGKGRPGQGDRESPPMRRDGERGGPPESP
jgi:outer membrane protein assembly factor BamB